MPRREYLRPDIRTELDTPEDLEMFKAVWKQWYSELGWAGKVHQFHLVEHADDRPLEVPALWALTYLAAHPDIAALNSDVKLKTQSAAHWTRGRYFFCKECQTRAGSVVEGNLVVQCQKCGAAIKFYAHPPLRKHRNE